MAPPDPFFIKKKKKNLQKGVSNPNGEIRIRSSL